MELSLFCNDYHKPNSVSTFDIYPMPRVDELIERLGRAHFISTLDLRKVYWQVPSQLERKPPLALPLSTDRTGSFPLGCMGHRQHFSTWWTPGFLNREGFGAAPRGKSKYSQEFPRTPHQSTGTCHLGVGRILPMLHPWFLPLPSYRPDQKRAPRKHFIDQRKPRKASKVWSTDYPTCAPYTRF